MNRIELDRLRTILDFDPETGLFKWAIDHSRKSKKGSLPGNINTLGYHVLCIDRKDYYAHRLAWFYVHGVWPSGDIDHINGIRSDNRLSNLRDVTHRVNLENRRRATRTNKTGYLGVSWSKVSGKYIAGIRRGGVSKHLGLFATPVEAHAAYLAAAEAYQRSAA